MQISQEVFDSLFEIMMFSTIALITIIPITWLTLTILTPKSLLDSYFKEPHFSTTELAFMRYIPSSLFRTMIFGWVLLFPFLDKKRKIRDCHKVMPAWYVVSLKIFLIISMFFIFSFFLTITFISFVDETIK